MKKTIEITVPRDWSAITYRTWLKLQADLKNYEEDEGAYDHVLLYHLCGITPDVLNQLDGDTLNSIKQDLTGFMNKSEDYPLQRLVKVGETEFGFEPNLGKMSYGAYLDISNYKAIELNEEWIDIVSILYREVKKKRGALYEIKTYKGVEPWESEKWLDMGMDFHFGCFFFFNRLYKDLQQGILKSTMNHQEISPNIKSILEESGKAIHHLQTLPKKTF
tara:strand:+ start:1340 stop:1996 length:657 start_codon:yes stop_codon:yes gene_type:complete